MPSEMFGRSAEPSELQMGAVRQGPQRIAALDHPIAVLVARWMHGVSFSSMWRYFAAQSVPRRRACRQSRYAHYPWDACYAYAFPVKL
jgi:hypothetical protein